MLAQVLLHCIEAAPDFVYRRARKISVDGFRRIDLIAQRLCKSSHVLDVCHGEQVMRLFCHAGGHNRAVLMRVTAGGLGGRFLFAMLVLMLLRPGTDRCKNQQCEYHPNACYGSFIHD
jgi:hypothetical protein